MGARGSHTQTHTHKHTHTNDPHSCAKNTGKIAQIKKKL